MFRINKEGTQYECGCSFQVSFCCRHILGDIQQGFNTLLETSGDDKLLHLVPKNPFDKMVYTTRQAETACIFNMCVLGDIGNTKNNLIGVRGAFFS